MVSKKYEEQLQEIGNLLNWDIKYTDDNDIMGFKISNVFMLFVSTNNYSNPTHYRFSVQPNNDIYRFFYKNCGGISDYFKEYTVGINAKIEQKSEILAKKIKKLYSEIADKEEEILKKIDEKTKKIEEAKSAVKMIADYLGKPVRENHQEQDYWYLKDYNKIEISNSFATLTISNVKAGKAIEIMEYLKLKEV